MLCFPITLEYFRLLTMLNPKSLSEVLDSKPPNGNELFSRTAIAK